MDQFDDEEADLQSPTPVPVPEEPDIDTRSVPSTFQPLSVPLWTSDYTRTNQYCSGQSPPPIIYTTTPTHTHTHTHKNGSRFRRTTTGWYGNLLVEIESCVQLPITWGRLAARVRKLEKRVATFIASRQFFGGSL